MERRHTQTIGAALIAEQEHLLPLAEEGFDLASLHFPHINACGCAKVLTNFYSAPLPVGTSVQVKVYSAYIEVWYQAKCVARHERFNGLEKGPTAKPVDIGTLSRYDRPLPSLDAYDRLRPNWLATEVIQ